MNGLDIKDKELYDKLVVDSNQRNEQIEKIIMDKVPNLIKIRTEDGGIDFENYDDLENTERILLFLIGKFLAKRLGLIEKTSFSQKDIYSELELPRTTVQGNLKKLKEKGYIIKTSEDSYTISYHRIIGILEGISNTRKGYK
jgi:biotin operon repressor